MSKAIELNEANFTDEVLNSTVPVLVDFWSPTCGPCRAVAPIMDRLVDEYGADAKIGKVNIFDNMNLAQQLDVVTLPTLIIFSKGRVVERMTGLQSQEKLMELLDEYCD